MSYNANSIELRAFKDACRETPGMYLGADREDGIFNSFLEILNNSCDEAIMGRGNHIIVTLSDDLNICTIQDFGAGIPRGPNDKSKEILIDLFTTAHSSGKFNTTNYKKVRGGNIRMRINLTQLILEVSRNYIKIKKLYYY